MANLPNVHDSFVRGLLADRQLAIDYFKSALPMYIADKLDFSTLEPLPGTYVSPELQTAIADVVYTCQRKNRKGSVHISLLLEHKSAPDNYTPVQIGGYLFSGYQQQIQQRKKQRGKQQLCPIIPVLLYHGRQKWEYWTLDRLFDGLDGELLGYLPNFDYIYHDLRGLSEETIKAVVNQFLVSALLMMKYASDKRKLKEKLSEILSIGLEHGSENQGVRLVIYGFELVELTEEEIKAILESLSSDIKEKVMSTYDLLIEKGIERGIKKGIEKGIEKGIKKGAELKSYDVVENLIAKLGFTDEQAADVAEVSIDFVRKVRTDLAEKKK